MWRTAHKSLYGMALQVSDEKPQFFMFYMEQIAGIGRICLNSYINEICQSNNKAVKSNMCRFIDEDKN